MYQVNLTERRPVPTAPLSRNAVSLIAQARSVIGDAARADSPGERFRLAHLSALRTAAAVLAERARPASGPRRVRSAWVLIDSIAPEYRDWAALLRVRRGRPGGHRGGFGQCGQLARG